MTHLKEVKSYGQFAEPKVFGGHHKNIVIRFDSTSGGFFSALANEMYRQKGYVSGAVFNEDWSVSNFISNDKRDLAKLRGSKYVESSAIGLYRRIKELLDSGENVLACGAPCQMAALRSFLGKQYDNLLIVDFLCRATNSSKAYRKYLDSLEAQFGSKITYIKAKNKEHGWRSLARKVCFENGKTYFGEGHDDHYRRGYHLNMFERPSCYSCKFKGLPRCADITLGDFWGIEKIDPSIDKDLGTSILLCNTDKGMAFFNKIRSKLVCKEFPLTDAIKGNLKVVMGGACTMPNVDRAALFADMDAMPFDELAKKYFPIKLASQKRSWKSCLKGCARFIKRLVREPIVFLRSLRYNEFCRQSDGSYLKNRGLKVFGNCAIDIAPKSKIICKKGILQFGVKNNSKSKRETQLLLRNGATLEVAGNNYIKPDSDIQVHEGGYLRVGKGGTNLGLKIVCSDKIHIGDNVRIGRDVWIRDNNGGHTVIQPGYKNSAPVTIENNVWICSCSSIMKGVTVGEGSIVSAHSVVTGNVPPHCIVSGNPAQVVAENIYWRP
jgi:acetyltransferase-like isoleucine patch superfamily enzyme/coenzyme F420-reducing hydrogenase beta subunit